MTKAEAIALAYRIASDFETAKLVLPAMECEELADGTVPWIDLHDIRTGEHVGRIYNEEEYDILLTAARTIAEGLTVCLN